MRKILFFLIIVYASIINTGHSIVIKENIPDDKYIQRAESFDRVIKIEIRSDNTFCSGVILNDKTILTSAHSVKHKKQINPIYNDEILSIEKIILHPTQDIAIIKTNKKIPNINSELEVYYGEYLDNFFDVVGFGKTGTGLLGAKKYDFKKRAGKVLCIYENHSIVESKFSMNSDYEDCCVGYGDSGGGLFKEGKLAGTIVFSTAKGGDNNADGTYGDNSGYIKTKDIISWINEYN